MSVTCSFKSLRNQSKASSAVEKRKKRQKSRIIPSIWIWLPTRPNWQSEGLKQKWWCLIFLRFWRKIVTHGNANPVQDWAYNGPVFLCNRSKKTKIWSSYSLARGGNSKYSFTASSPSLSSKPAAPLAPCLILLICQHQDHGPSRWRICCWASPSFLHPGPGQSWTSDTHGCW